MVPPRSVAATAGDTGSASGFTPTTDAVLSKAPTPESLPHRLTTLALGRYTVISNTTDGAWPICRFLGDRLG